MEDNVRHQEYFDVEKKATHVDRLFLYVVTEPLGKADSLTGTNTCARAALGAGICVDLIDVAFRDCLYRTLGQAGAASDTVVSNYVSHNDVYLMFLYNR